jgi:hypothetical protein
MHFLAQAGILVIVSCPMSAAPFPLLRSFLEKSKYFGKSDVDVDIRGRSAC